jgi:hypothetical protein
MDSVNKHKQPKNSARSIPKNSKNNIPIHTSQNFIQNMTQTPPPTVYKTPNLQTVLTVLLSAQEDIQNLQIQFQIHPWNLQLTTPDTHTPQYCDNFSTFIIHKSNINNTSWKSNAVSSRHSTTPHFYCFDHGDHLHIVFPSKHHSNTNRSINRILKYLEGSPAGTAEAYTTVQLVKYIKQFIYYLVRYGLRNFYKFGTKISLSFLKILTNLIPLLIQTYNHALLT